MTINKDLPGLLGICLIGGGSRYFSNSWVALRLLRQHGCTLPVTIWVFEDEQDDRIDRWIRPYGAEVKVAHQKKLTKGLPPGARWQWMLKPWAMLNSGFREVLLLDADNFPVRNPEYLFSTKEYRETGALFWPDIPSSFRTGPENPIWKDMGIPFRHEREFESGQMVIDVERHREPLELALEMNLQAEKYYRMLWGDKDTFRFAFHKYGRPYSMTPHDVEVLEVPGGPPGVGVMCQHDFEGRRVFQHRNMAKWDLLGENPRIPGFLYEEESREYLRELRRLWNGRVGSERVFGPPLTLAQVDERKQLRKEMTRGVWLVEDRRPGVQACCGPMQEWSEERVPYAWERPRSRETDGKEGLPMSKEGAGAAAVEAQAPAGQSAKLRCAEMTFLADSVGKGASKDGYWWEVEWDRSERKWLLHLLGEAGKTATMVRQEDGSWEGWWAAKEGTTAQPSGKRKAAAVKRDGLRLLRVEHCYPEKSGGRAVGLTAPSLRLKARPAAPPPLHVANHAFGIGDAVTGLYACVGMVKAGARVVYHTRFPEWLARASFPGLEITAEAPPEGAADLNRDYGEQLRYAGIKARWYGMMGRLSSVGPSLPARPKLNLSVGVPAVDFTKYVVLAPFAAWAARDWPEGHWRRLAFLLNEVGYEIVVVGVKSDEERMERTFSQSNAYWVLDSSPAWVQDLMLGAQAVIGLDSGMIHVAGMLGVPGICIHTHLPPEFLFAGAPSIRSVTAKTDCVFCRWQPDRGFNEGCQQACSALGSVGPQQVMECLQSEGLVQAMAKSVLRFRHVVLPPESDRAPLLATVERRPDVIAYTYRPDCGLGEAAAANLTAMRAAGLTVEQRIVETSLRERVATPDQIYYHHWHPQQQDRNFPWQTLFGFQTHAHHLAYWAYELEDALPPEFEGLAPFMSELWTPSRFCRQIFSSCGLPTSVVPHMVPAVAGPLRALPSVGGKAPFTVLFLFDAWSRMARKNPLAVIRVFQKAFARRLDVRLVIKAHHLSEAEERQLFSECGWDSRIQLVNKFLSAEQLEQLFDRADVLLSLQRGEGFGLNLARALGRGLPLITTGYGGQLDFCKPDNSWLVPWKYVTVANEKDWHYDQGKWADPDEKTAVKLLSEVAAMVQCGDPELARKRERGRRLIAAKFSQQSLQACIRQKFGNRLQAKFSDLKAVV